MRGWSVCVIGAGKIGSMIAELLHRSSDYRVTIADSDPGQLTPFGQAGMGVAQVDATDVAALSEVLHDQDAVISAAPFFLTPKIAQAARNSGTHYFDLTEDVAATQAVREMAEGARTAFMPQCGLAPGFVGIAGASLAKGFDKLDTLALRVGALPLYPTNALKYNLTWSTDGLINEYCNPCDVIVGGQRTKAQPLADLDIISVDGVDYECFNTSGGLGTLTETMLGQARELSYRTIRYPGHRDIIRMLLHDLRLDSRRDLLREVFETALPRTDQDVVLVFCTATGWIDGEYREKSFLNKSLAVELNGGTWGAIQITTAAGVTGAMDLMRQGKLPNRGFVRQEQVDLSDFLQTEFGRYYGAGTLTQMTSGA